MITIVRYTNELKSKNVRNLHAIDGFTYLDEYEIVETYDAFKDFIKDVKNRKYEPFVQYRKWTVPFYYKDEYFLVEREINENEHINYDELIPIYNWRYYIDENEMIMTCNFMEGLL